MSVCPLNPGISGFFRLPEVCQCQGHNWAAGKGGRSPAHWTPLKYWAKEGIINMIPGLSNQKSVTHHCWPNSDHILGLLKFQSYLLTVVLWLQYNQISHILWHTIPARTIPKILDCLKDGTIYGIHRGLPTVIHVLPKRRLWCSLLRLCQYLELLFLYFYKVFIVKSNGHIIFHRGWGTTILLELDV